MENLPKQLHFRFYELFPRTKEPTEDKNWLIAIRSKVMQYLKRNYGIKPYEVVLELRCGSIIQLMQIKVQPIWRAADEATFWKYRLKH